MATLANRNICEYKRKTSSQFSHRITELATLLGKTSKSGVTLGFRSPLFSIVLNGACVCGFENVLKRSQCGGNLCNDPCGDIYKDVRLLKRFSFVFESLF